MDAFAIARLRAQALRADHGYGFAAAHDLVAHALRVEFGFGIAPTNKDGSALNGDDAQIDARFSQILVRDDVNRAEQAVLLAHELGHLVLHGAGEPCEARTSGIDADCRAISRLETYGPRERRELQANVFAREFLLPRALARKLFLDEELKTEEVAERLGLPPSIVRRQLLDATLRPVDRPSTGTAGPPIELDPSQQAAVDHPGRALLVEAGPGAGKTRTLISRIEKRLADGIPARQILVLTFSNKAAAECADRLATRVGEKAAEVWVGTFHAFGLELLRLFHAQLGLPATVRLILPAQIVEMLEERLPLIGLKHFHDLRRPGEQLKALLAPISRAKDELIGAERFRTMAEADLAATQARLAADPSPLVKQRKLLEAEVAAAEKACEAAAVYEVLESMLREQGLVDLADLIMRPTLLIEENAAVRAALQNRFSDILVDEYQDVNRGSARLLRALYGTGNRIWAVGDSRQAIYRFRGASARNIELFAQDFPGAEKAPLALNYRSGESVVALCRKFAERMDERAAAHDPMAEARTPYAAKSRRGTCGSEPILLVGADDACEAELVAQEIRALAEAGVPLGRQTVLARVNSRLDKLAHELAARGIAVAHLGSFFERDVVRDVLSVLSLVSEPNGGALARIAAQRGVEVGAGAIARVVEHARQRAIPLVNVLADAPDIEEMEPEAAANLVRLGEMLRGLSASTAAIDVAATWLLDRSPYLRHLAEAEGLEAELDRSAVRQLLEFLDQQELDGRPLQASEALRRVRTVILMADDRDLREPELGSDVQAVRLMTVHAAKGLEFEAVHVVGLHQNGFPLKRQAQACRPPFGVGEGTDAPHLHEGEEDNLMFVALSRAEVHLRLYHSEKALTQGRKPSRFFADLDIVPHRRLDEAPAAVPRVQRAPEAIAVDSLSLHDIRDFATCPLKVLYRHGLAIRSRRHESPFLQTSGVIYELIDRVGDFAGADAKPDVVNAMFETIWTARGPGGHSLEPHYRRIAQGKLEDVRRLVAGYAAYGSTAIAVPIAGGFVKTPAPLLRMGAKVVARFVRMTVPKADDLETGVLFAAGIQAMATGGVVEVAALADGNVVQLLRSTDQVSSDLARAGEILAAIRSGDLEARPQMRICVRCAQFFACPATGFRPS
jgi:DNA helicase II / ATP-dependent DNA helicase PcrA